MPVSAERGQAWCKVNTGRGWLEETKVFYGQCFKSGLTVLGEDLVICLGRAKALLVSTSSEPCRAALGCADEDIYSYAFRGDSHVLIVNFLPGDGFRKMLDATKWLQFYVAPR
jgi:hypothetical protein